MPHKRVRSGGAPLYTHTTLRDRINETSRFPSRLTVKQSITVLSGLGIVYQSIWKDVLGKRYVKQSPHLDFYPVFRVLISSRPR